MTVAKWAGPAFAVLLCAATAMALPGQTLTTLVSFNVTNGLNPYYANLTQGTDGSLYGATFSGGANNDGEVFKVSLGGKLTVLHSFNVTDGDFPLAGVVLATSGNLFGTTTGCISSPTCSGGSDGTVYKITPAGKLTTLVSFNVADGWNIGPGLIQGTDGDFYGLAFDGGANNDGEVFKVTPGGTLTVLHSFNVTDGANPCGALVEGTDGGFYGVAQNGGANNDGEVFKMTPKGKLTVLHSFDATDGYVPCGLIQATDGNFYGTTTYGGAYNNGEVFKITPGGTLTILHSFNVTDGNFPSLGEVLSQGTDGSLYGSTCCGGAYNNGTVFNITLGGVLTTLHSFNVTDGVAPDDAPVQATDGNFYGMTAAGGANNDGSIYRLSVGLGPFVKTLPTSGHVGAAIKILGTNLANASSVTFNGIATGFTIVAPSLLTTTVPTGATTGAVQVTTPSGTLLSNVVFRVTP